YITSCPFVIPPRYLHSFPTRRSSDLFAAMPSVSIDYGIMEKAEHIYTIPGTFGWDDVGSWLAVERIKKTNEDGNVVNGNVITIRSEEHTSELQSRFDLVCRLLLEKKI